MNASTKSVTLRSHVGPAWTRMRTRCLIPRARYVGSAGSTVSMAEGLSPWDRLNHGGTYSLSLLTCWKLCLTKTKNLTYPKRWVSMLWTFIKTKHTFSSFPVAKFHYPSLWSWSSVPLKNRLDSSQVGDACPGPTSPLIFSSGQNERFPVGLGSCSSVTFPL